MLTIHELVQSAQEELKSYLEQEEQINEDAICDLIHEIADAHVPIYTSDVLKVALSNFHLACCEPELGPVFGIATPVNLLMTNIYEYLRDELSTRYHENKIEE